MALAINLLALVIVLGMCWGSMMWLSGRFHGHGGATTKQIDGVGDFGQPASPHQMGSDAPCATCEGVGARNTNGKLEPCHACYGTGVLT